MRSLAWWAGGVWSLLAVALGPAVWAQQTSALIGGDITAEAAAAQQLYEAQKMLDALPLYEDLHAQEPKSLGWTERLALALLSKEGTQDGTEAIATRDRAHALLVEAQAAGDDSPLVQILLEKMSGSPATAPKGPESPGMPAFRRAEKAFSSGNLPGALKLYEEAAMADPKLYEAPLYAGDTEYKLKHFAEAGTWYAKAVAINPDRETAYRYWGDCLMKQGDQPEGGRGEVRRSGAGRALHEDDAAGSETVGGCKPCADYGTAGEFACAADLQGQRYSNITVDPNALDGAGSSAGLMYAMGAVTWHNETFKKTYPNETEYRHSLAEEADSIRLGLTVLKEQKIKPDKLDATWKTLMQLDADGMRESWILLDHADQGVAQDYGAYREKHRETMHAYMVKYDVHAH
jgi:tetratricopeptide (TPR) repeat protein